MKLVKDLLTDSANLKQKVSQNDNFALSISNAFLKIKNSLTKGGTIYSCGNGGSACDAMHLTEELVARFKRERPGMRAMHFMDSSTLTCWSNDYDYKGAFERQAQTFCTDKDVLIGISTSGNSENILRALKAAKEKGAVTIGLLGKGGGKIAPECDVSIIVPSEVTERIQEVHILVIHILCELLES